TYFRVVALGHVLEIGTELIAPADGLVLLVGRHHRLELQQPTLPLHSRHTLPRSKVGLSVHATRNTRHTAGKGGIGYLMVGFAEEDDGLVEATQPAEDLLAREKGHHLSLRGGLLLHFPRAPFLLFLLAR